MRPQPGASALWTGLVQAGLGLLGRLEATADGFERTGRAPLSFEREGNERTDQTYLKIRMPERAVVNGVADALQAPLGKPPVLTRPADPHVRSPDPRSRGGRRWPGAASRS